MVERDEHAAGERRGVVELHVLRSVLGQHRDAVAERGAGREFRAASVHAVDERCERDCPPRP